MRPRPAQTRTTPEHPDTRLQEGQYESSVATLEDKIVQRAVVEVLNAVYEVDFRGFSYGFRPGRSPHQALDALAAGIERKKVNWVLDADIRDFFGQLDRGWLERFLRHRIADERVLRLIGNGWPRGSWRTGYGARVQGLPQGASVSPLLANVYLHYVLDLFVEWWRRHHARGEVIIVRFADDFIVGFEYEQDARRFLAGLRVRFAKFGLELHPDKTRLIEFGRFAAGEPGGEGSGQAGDIRLPGLHAHLRGDQERAVPAETHHDRQADAGEAGRGQRPAEAPHAPADPGAGPLAGQRGARAYGVLRRARQHPGGGGLPRPR